MSKFLDRYIVISLGSIPRSEVAGSYGKLMFNFIRDCQAVSQSGGYYFASPPAVYECV